MLCQRTGATLLHASAGDGGSGPGVSVDSVASLVTSKTKLIAVSHVSNVLGGCTDVAGIVDVARSKGSRDGPGGRGCRVLLDSCQAAPHAPLDLPATGADWAVFSGHKMLGPTGVGCLWGTPDALEAMPPWMGGGEMIRDVSLSSSTYAPPPGRFEAGTPAIAEAVALGEACRYLTHVGMDRVAAFEHEMAGLLWETLSSINDVQLYGPPPGCPRGRASLASFNVRGLHASDVAALLDQAGVAVRSGHHCAQPLHSVVLPPCPTTGDRPTASARASLYLYNTPGEVEALGRELRDTIKFFRECGL